MTDSRVRVDVTGETQLRDPEPSGNATAFFTEPPKLTQVAQTLAAHGGGEFSFDLALDLVLNDIVEQARTVTGATGAAVALYRDGELTCRATSGVNAPDLGVRVDATSSLAGACMSTGEIQQCGDTETDARVNAEACRRLGVRSMLIAPLVDGQKLIGVIQVFASWPDAFGKREITAMQVLAGRIAESNREAEAGISLPELDSAPTEPAEIMSEPIIQDEQEEAIAEESEPLKRIDVWGAVLVTLVIAAAIALGLVIGWRKAAEFSKSAHSKMSVPNISQITETPAPATPNVASNEPAATSTKDDASAAPPLAAKPVPLAGGLLVTQNGKVVYRSPSQVPKLAANQSAARSLVHRVNPEYPAEARTRNIQGPVVLDVQVLGDGTIGTISVVSGDPLLARSAIDAVKLWRYQPESANGQGVESQTRITVKFTLPKS
jgi:TonB family protein